uniref:Gingipain domain-containing protein n=1 Tax=uncultured nuHF2 cluster bacterium HF0500_31B05 TaxID=723589 RepID=E7C5V8_9BACT|nr:hypothetical protein [uncultured nuHF2 cluster bacterium HF0500_31B05]
MLPGSFAALLTLILAARVGATPLEVVAADATGFTVEFRQPAHPPIKRQIQGEWIDDLLAPGPRPLEPGVPSVPFRSALISAPDGAEIRLEVLEAHYVQYGEIDLPPVAPPQGAGTDRVELRRDEIAYSTDSFGAGELATAAYLGIQRGVRSHRLHIHPFRYNPVQRVLRVYDRLVIRVHFEGGHRWRGPIAGARRSSLHDHFLNPVSPMVRHPAAKVIQNEWYDRSQPWVKLIVDRDELFRVERRFLEGLNLDLDGVDPRTVRLYHRGREQTVHVFGEEDGTFDDGDYVLFYGRFRRDDRDFDSIFGRQNTYWLTWGGEPGQRFVEQVGAPTSQFPESGYHWSMAHFEQDLWYDPLPDAPDNLRDHWFWDQPVFATKPDVPSSRIFARDLAYPKLDEEYTARIRVALHGTTNLGHHTVVKLNNKEIEDAVWEGQVEHEFEVEIPSSYLRDGTNRVLLQAFADQAKWDQVFFNWFAIDYRRLYRASVGFLSFERPAISSGERITISGFRNREIRLFDVANGIRFIHLEIDSTETGIEVTFEHQSPQDAVFVIADSARILTPAGSVDQPSLWRTPNRAADYLIITHPLFMEAAERLARHRQRGGLRVEIVSTEDIYDEFSYGIFDREAVKAMVQYSYDAWDTRPSYLLLLGDATFDYRNLFGGGAPSFVPSTYYHARNRGHAPSDAQYGFLEGDDLLPDLAVGRLAVGSAEEAEAAVDKIIAYDADPEPGPWRGRIVYGANYHPRGLFTEPSDRLAERYTEPLGLRSIKVYNADNAPIPNATGKRFLDALNDGALLVNFSGHGSAGTMQFLFSLQFSDWDYLSQLNNGRRLPLVLALSCLNGMFANPHVESLGEVFTDKPSGGSIAYISATAESFVAQNELLGDNLFSEIFERGNLEFGPSLNAAKTQVLAAHSSFKEAVLTMQLFGDPAQKLALQGAPDFVAAGLSVASEVLFPGETASIKLQLDNHSIATPDSVRLLLLAHSPAGSDPDTLLDRQQPGFTAEQALEVPWSIGPAGRYNLELQLDPHRETADDERQNNSYQLGVEVLEPLVPTLSSPKHHAVSSRRVALRALVRIDRGPLACEFALASNSEFAADNTLLSPPIMSSNGVAIHQVDVAEDEVYFWRARIVRNGAAGPWSAFRSFASSSEPAPPDWRQTREQFVAPETTPLQLDRGGALVLSPSKQPFRMTGAQREGWFTVSQLEGAGVVCADGTYLYAKRWFNDASTVYPGSDYFTRIGTGFNGTSAGMVYDTLADSTTAGISATYHSDGFIYNESGRAFELERIAVSTGVMDTVEVPDGLLEWKYGGVEDGHSLITSDGKHIYNVSMSSQAGTRTEWRVRVFDPANGWALLRDFASPPTETGFTYKWTDGALADTENLYFIEFSGGHRVRRVDPNDGTLQDESMGDQDSTRVVSGQYDWINNRVWLGDLFGPTIYRYSGGDRVEEAELISPAIGPAATWRSVAMNATGTPANVRIDLLARSAADTTWLPLSGFSELSPNASIEISSVPAAAHRYLKLRARFSGAGAAGLSSWSLRYTPLPSLQVVNATGEVDSVLRVEAVVRILEPPANDAVVIQVENAAGTVLASKTIDDLTQPGAAQIVRFDGLVPPGPEEERFVRLLTAQPDADPHDNRLAVTFQLSADPTLVVVPSGRTFQDGDFLRSDESLWIHLPSVAAYELLMDGGPVEADSVRIEDDGGQRLLYRPTAPEGRHRLLIRASAVSGESRQWSYRFLLRNDLSIARSLVYPQPVRESADFTFLLSHEATVTVRVYSLSGRLVRRLDKEEHLAGFCKVSWDGRDQAGTRVANGVYLYRIDAHNDVEAAVVRGPLTVVR